ncbi:hypothetical protein QN277_003223 [Acacia crassicarpa]|uniref:Dof zinc finger protein n=1 Tax=Acacia crassicarpa TaxID=499986 RepID=A0AAE1MH67_9FABA|nr:hypothetical protein QN277_003223 [Acacia crassicarpa]
MIQELLGASSSGFISTGERNKISINAASVLAPPLPSPSLPSSTAGAATTTTSGATAAAAASSNSEHQNLRCPRCDSSNTKFCYYNNYNLTQPRHFCKTCRRYWTKGGALRNVPIGGGCRKNKSVVSSSTSSNSVAAAKTSVAVAGNRMKTAASELGILSRPGLGGGGGFDYHQELPASPILWGTPQNSHLMALLRASHQNHNPNPSPCPPIPNISVKEGNLMRSHMVTEPIMVSNSLLNNNVPPTSNFDPSLGLTSSFWRNNNLDHHQQSQNGGFVYGGGDHQNSSGIQELYQRLRSSSSSSPNYCNDDSSSSQFLSNMSSSSSSVAIVESTAASNGGSGIGLGYWNNQPLFWSDLPTTNGAHP